MEEFLDNVLIQLEDIKFDVDMDLGPQSVPYQKIKSLIEDVTDYQDSLET